MKYRTEIDGLRALAVVPVILFHAGFELFSGGFVGVDVFFVISGYLITTILIDDIEIKRFSLIDFYERRARRLLPALYLMMAITFIVSGFFWSPYDIKNVAQSIVATTFFANNLLLILEGNDYFNALNFEADINPLIHTWSLAVEEQFYMVFPLLLLIRSFKINSRYLPLILVLGMFSLSWALYRFNFTTPENQHYIFYATEARVWQLLLGSVCAVLIRDKLILKVNSFWSTLLASLGVMLLLASIFEIVSTETIGYLFFLIPSVGSALIILFTLNENYIKKLLSIRIFVVIGLGSYSLYLWHQPILSFFSYKLVQAVDKTHKIDTQTTLVALLLTAGVAFLSYFFVERPFRNRQLVKLSTLSLGLFVVSIVFVFIGSLGHATSGFWRQKISDRQHLYINSDLEVAKVKNSDWGKIENIQSPIGVIGDSTSQDLQKAFQSVGVRVDNFPLDGTCFKKIIINGDCRGTSLAALVDFVNGKSRVYLVSNILGEGKDAVDGYILMYEKFSIETEFFVIGPFQFNKVSNVSFVAASRGVNPEEIFFKAMDSRIKNVENLLLEKIPGSRFISKYNMYCDDKIKKCNLYDVNELPIFHDGLHHTVEGWRDYGLRMSRFIRSGYLAAV